MQQWKEICQKHAPDNLSGDRILTMNGVAGKRKREGERLVFPLETIGAVSAVAEEVSGAAEEEKVKIELARSFSFQSLSEKAKT